MFDTVKFGNALSTLRKNADMTQSEMADKLNLTRQAVSKYERGESFPDISILLMISELFGVTLDKLVSFGGATEGEAAIFEELARGGDVTARDINDVVNLAPLLKPSVLERLSKKFGEQGIDITGVVQLAEYLNNDSVIRLIESASIDELGDELLEKFLPVLNVQSKDMIFAKILEGEMDWRFIKALLPYADYYINHIEAAVVYGALPQEALTLCREYAAARDAKRRAERERQGW